MKYITTFSVILITLIIMFSVLMPAKTANNVNADYLRIHVRANSNELNDQKVKYEIKDIIIEYITPLISTCETKSQVVEMIERENVIMKDMINEYLKKQGFDYTANIIINSEYFPTRSYDGVTLISGVYDAIIVELGSALGNNWWCVAYPPLCFVDYDPNSNIIYKSKILEIINNFFNGR